MRFLLVKTIHALVPGESIEAEMSLPANEELFQDHFPGFPVVPGVLLTEMMAQAAGKCLNAQRLPRGNAMLVEVRSAKFRSWVRPDEPIRLHARIESNAEAFAVAKCHAAVNGRKACSAELLFSFKPIAEFAPDYRDEVLEQYLSLHHGTGEPVVSTERTVVDPFQVHGQRILVVGGSRGIGRAIAWRLASAGASVLVNYVRERGPAEALAAEAATAGLAVDVVRADVTSDKGREELFAAVDARFPALDAVVFAAATGVHRPFDQLTGRHFDFTFALNVRAFLSLVQSAAPRMTQGGAIVAISSEGAVHAMHHYTLVGASKGALESMARHLANELAGRGIRVNVLSPGTVRTDAWNAMPDAEQRLSAAATRSPLGRLVTLDEVAAAAQFLVSPASSGLVGHTLVIDGGSRLVGSG